MPITDQIERVIIIYVTMIIHVTKWVIKGLEKIIMFNNNIKKLYEKSKLERIGRTI